MFKLDRDKYWQTIVNTMMDGLMVVDVDGKIVFVNRALEEMSGYRKEELIGKSCQILECDTCLEAIRKGGTKHCALFMEQQVRRCRCTMKRKNGEPLPVLKNAVVLKDDKGQIVGGVETLTDLRESVAKEEEIARLRRHLNREDGFEGIIGKHPSIQRVFELIVSAASSDAPVIIYGESGTGKELVAAAIHRLSSRRFGPYIKVNCAALNEHLLESELFGHVKGAFTGADRTRVGRFEAAHRGSIFLDEIGDIPLGTQVKLLRVLQEKEIERVGDHRPIAVDVRIISATNKNLKVLIEQGRFRDDFYYRIAVIPIMLPPLRERKEDIPLLVDHFASRLCLKTGKDITGISHDALARLMEYHWPGNVRELINVLEYAFVVCPGGQIMIRHLPPSFENMHGMGSLEGVKHAAIRKNGSSRVLALDKETILNVLKETGGNRSEAARRLGISRITLWKKMKNFRII
ncbi:MAG: sigma 54-interacting transcriptional regulator [Thermodesulforhabdaceae bacterium]